MNTVNEIVQVASGNAPLQVNVNLQPDAIAKIALAVFIGVVLATLFAGIIVKRYA